MQIEVIWEQLAGNGIEHLKLRMDNNIQADGLAVGVLEDVPYRIRYEIVCDNGWTVQRATVEDLLKDETLTLIKGADGSWTDEHRKSLEHLKGCTEVDIRITPFTNSLPINRLGLALHESREITVAYFHVPGLTVSKLDQKYTFLSSEKGLRTYKYESLDSGFTADIQVNPDGLVTDYPGIFKMIWKRTL